MGNFLSKIGINSYPSQEKIDTNTQKAEDFMTEAWGPPGSPDRKLIQRYWVATRMEQHWSHLRAEHPHQFKKHFKEGYMEPIPQSWVQDRRLAQQLPGNSTYETPAEERLYYLFNNGTMPDGFNPHTFQTLKRSQQMNAIIARGTARFARQVPIDRDVLAAYGSPADVFLTDPQSESNTYSAQVPHEISAARQTALASLADDIRHGADHLETMLLLDVSGSMAGDPRSGILGPDRRRRVHDQPPTIRLVEHLVHRALHHMVPRTQKEHPHQPGVDTVVFSTHGRHVGQLSTRNWHADWWSKITANLGGGARLMPGWQAVKSTYFARQHARHGHGVQHPVYGWQPTRGMPTLSLLVLLGGDAPPDLDEFALELLGATWAYVTIVLVGMEGCPHHHGRAVEWGERVARFNPRVGVFDVQGRVCERLGVEEVLRSVYPVDPPGYEEIVRPEFELRREDDGGGGGWG